VCQCTIENLSDRLTCAGCDLPRWPQTCQYGCGWQGDCSTHRCPLLADDSDFASAPSSRPLLDPEPPIRDAPRAVVAGRHVCCLSVGCTWQGADDDELAIHLTECVLASAPVAALVIKQRVRCFIAGCTWQGANDDELALHLSDCAFASAPPVARQQGVRCFGAGCGWQGASDDELALHLTACPFTSLGRN
jgi:hypothetical protein